MDVTNICIHDTFSLSKPSLFSYETHTKLSHSYYQCRHIITNLQVNNFISFKKRKIDLMPKWLQFICCRMFNH